MGSLPVIREKCLPVKEKWALSVDKKRLRLLLSMSHLSVTGRAFHSTASFSIAAAFADRSMSAWRLYWSAHEEADALA